MVPDDLKYAGAAWRKGGLDLDFFTVDAEATADEFKAALFEHLVTYYQAHFTLIAETPEGRIPVGLALLYRPDPRAPVMWLGAMVWFPWASPRNRVETMVHFMNAVRADWVILEFARPQDKGFFEQMCRYGVMRRMGTALDLYPDPAAVYQTRKPQVRKTEWPSERS